MDKDSRNCKDVKNEKDYKDRKADDLQIAQKGRMENDGKKSGGKNVR